NKARRTERDREGVELQQDEKSEQALRAEPDEGLRQRYLSAWQRAFPGPLDLAVEIAIGDVVQGAACTPHHQRTEGEKEEQPEIRQRPRRGGESNGPETGQ